jgi:hypothetical protein
MRSDTKFGLRTVVGAAGLGIASLALIAAPAGAQTPKITVKPDTGLAKTATVKVSGKNLPANTEVGIVECTSAATGESGCDVATAALATTSASGKLAATDLTVSSKFTDEGGSAVKCTTKVPCAVAVGSITGTEYGAVVISFK